MNTLVTIDTPRNDDGEINVQYTQYKYFKINRVITGEEVIDLKAVFLDIEGISRNFDNQNTILSVNNHNNTITTERIQTFLDTPHTAAEIKAIEEYKAKLEIKKQEINKRREEKQKRNN